MSEMDPIAALLAEAFVSGLKTGSQLVSDFAQYDEEDWEREKKEMTEFYQKKFRQVSAEDAKRSFKNIFDKLDEGDRDE